LANKPRIPAGSGHGFNSALTIPGDCAARLPLTKSCGDRKGPLIHFENVGLRYGMGPEVLRDLTFDIPKRSFQFLTGPSGAGKTTLMRLLFMSLKPTRG
jgi:cell division transport system ATP-binding protein